MFMTDAPPRAALARRARCLAGFHHGLLVLLLGVAATACAPVTITINPDYPTARATPPDAQGASSPWI